MPVLPKLMWKLQYLSDADFKEMNKPKTRGAIRSRKHQNW